MKGASRVDLAAFWRELGLEPGRPVLCHSFIASLGKPETSAEHDVLGSLLDTVGPEGTLFAPAFSYSYFNGETYVREESSSKVGVLGDLVRNHRDGVRSLDPIFSNAGIGPDAAKFLARDNPRSFGPGTFYDRLVEADAQILLIGVDFTSLSLFMHVERMNDVPYRYEKTFSGTTRDGARQYRDEAIHFVRALEYDFTTDRTGVGAAIEAQPSCRILPYGYGSHRLTTARTVFDTAQQFLTRDRYSLIRLNPDSAIRQEAN